MPSAAKRAPVFSWDVTYDWPTEEEETRVWFTDGSGCYSGITQKQTAAVLQCLSGTKDKGISTVGRTSCTHAVTFCLEGEMVYVLLFTDSGLQPMDQGLGKSIIGILEDIWGSCLCSNVNAHQKMISAQEKVSNQVGRRTHSVDSPPLSLLLLSLLSRLVSKVAMVAEIGMMLGLNNNGLPLAKAHLTTAAAERQICQQQRPTLNPR